MTNEQQAVYLRGIASRLAAAISQAREQMPADAEREAVSVYKGDKDPMNRIWDRKNWVSEPVGEYTALASLVALLEHIQEDVALLSGKKEES